MISSSRPADLPRRRPDVHARGVDSEVLVLDRVRGFIHQLNPTAAFVWMRCTGDRSAVDIARELADIFEVTPEIAARDVAATVAQFRALQLMDTDADPLGESTAA